MGHITIADLDAAVLQALQTRALSNGRSLEDEVRDIVTRNVRAEPVPHRVLTRAERLSMAESIRAMTPPGYASLAEDLIREGRDSR